MKIFTNAFLSVMNRDIDQNVLDSTRERSNYDKNLRKAFVSNAAGSKEEQKSREKTKQKTDELEESLEVIRIGKNADLIINNYSLQIP